MLTPQAGGSHILRGNRMRHDPIRSRELMYDFRWLSSSSVVNALAWLVAPFNRQLVYSNDLY